MKNRLFVLGLVVFLIIGFAYTAKVTVLSEEVVAGRVVEHYKLSKNNIKYHTKVQINGETIIFEDRETYINSLNKEYIDILVIKDEVSGKVFTSYRVLE